MESRVKLIRKQLDMTQEQLAQYLGIGKAALSMIETGKTGLSTRNKNILVHDLNVNPDWLETGRGRMFNAEPDLTAYMHRTDNTLPLAERTSLLGGGYRRARAAVRRSGVGQAGQLHPHPQSAQVRRCDIRRRRLDVPLCSKAAI